MYYAELDGNDIVKHIAQGPGVPPGDRFIEIESYDETLLGRKYENGEFIELIE